MSDMLKTGMTWLEQKRNDYCSSNVTYYVGDVPVSVSATFGKTNVEVADESGLSVASRVWDFIVPVESLSREPMRGDIIVADGRRYEVIEFSGERCWRFTDSFRLAYRIHTQDVGEA